MSIDESGRYVSVACSSSPRTGKTLTSNPAVLRKYPLVEKTSGHNLEEKSGVEFLKAVSCQYLASLWQLPYGRELLQIKPVASTHRRSRQTGSPAGHSNHPLSWSLQTFLCHRTLVEGLVSGLWTVYPLLTLNFFNSLCDVVM